MTGPITDDDARGLRKAWFDYVDTVEALRAPLHAYGMKLTGNVWDAEDLVQETLLKGFAMIGRGDLHGPGSPVANPRAYLFRTATNLWLDGERRRQREQAILAEPQPEPAMAGSEAVREAGERLYQSTSPQARAAVVLKDVFEFTLEEIADQLKTTVGGVKAALSRGRAGLRGPSPSPPRAAGPKRAFIEQFIHAFNSRDLGRLTAALSETCSIEVPGVGGGRGRRGGWAESSLQHAGVLLEPGVYQGENLVLFFSVTPDGPKLYDVVRLEEEDGLVTRLVHHCFCPDTIRVISDELDLPVAPLGYHQPAEVLPRMIATTTLPWGEGMKLH